MVRASTREGIATLGLDRPEKGNALSVELVAALHAAIDAAIADTDVHTLVLAGSGKHFCTGFDLSSLAPIAGRVGPTPEDFGQDLTRETTAEEIRAAEWWKDEYNVKWSG